MKNFIQSLKDKHEAKLLQQAEEQQKRIARLNELEAMQVQKGFGLLHPVQFAKNKKEIKQLQTEIEAYKNKKEQSKFTLGLVAMLVAMFCFLGVMSLFENAENTSSSSINSANLSSQYISSVKPSSNVTTSITSSTDVSSDSISSLPESSSSNFSSIPEIPPSSDTSSENVSSNISSEVTSALPSINTKFSIEDVSVYWETDFAHIKDIEHARLGNQEGLTISISVEKASPSVKDLHLQYDKNLLNVVFKDSIIYTNSATFEYYVTAKTSCDTLFIVCTADDFATLGEEALAYSINIVKLNSYEGTIVYIAPTGEKYHTSKSCAGSSATKTTRRDATTLDYSPCKVCAK